MKKFIIFNLLFLFSLTMSAQNDQKIYDIIEAVSAERIKNDVKIIYTLSFYSDKITFHNQYILTNYHINNAHQL